MIICAPRFLSLGLAVLLVAPLGAHAEEMAMNAPWVAHVLRQTETPQIQGLVFPEKKLVVRLIPKENELRPLVELKGVFDRPNWTLTVQGQKPTPSETNPKEFSVYAYLNSQVNEIRFAAKGPERALEEETLYVFAPEAQEFQVVSTWDSLTLSAGLTSLMYEQSFFGRYRSGSGLLRVSYDSPDSSRRWGYLLQGNITVLSFASSPIQANPQAIDLHGALTYKLGLFEEGRFRNRLFVGGDYQALSSNGSPFGFAGLMAPELGWALKYFEDSRNTYQGQLRWVMYKRVSTGDQRSWVADFVWSSTLKSLRRRDLGFSLYDSTFSSDGQKIRLNMISFLVGFSI